MRVHSRPWTKVQNLRPPDANPEVMFRPRGFSPPRRVSPRKGSQACCILQPTLGFAAFHRTSRSQPRSPRRDHPSKDSPNRSWYSGHPEPWPPWRSSSLIPGRPSLLTIDRARDETGTFEALSARMVCDVRARCRARTPCPSWASVSSSRSTPIAWSHRPPRRREG